MNDEFIYKALPKVPQAFSQSLYAQISANATSQKEVQFRARRLRWLQASIIILGLLILVAWSQAIIWVRYVPIGDLWLVEISRPKAATVDQQPLMGPVPTPRQYPTVIVQGTVYYAWNVRYLSPDWIPAGFQQMPPTMDSYGSIIATWNNDAKETIQLFGAPETGGMKPYAPSGMYEEVVINNHPAILIHGRLALKKPGEKARKWDETLGLQLTWKYEEVIYTLETFGLYVSESDLIRMAESMKPVPWPEVP